MKSTEVTHSAKTFDAPFRHPTNGGRAPPENSIDLSKIAGVNTEKWEVCRCMLVPHIFSAPLFVFLLRERCNDTHTQTKGQALVLPEGLSNTRQPTKRDHVRMQCPSCMQ